VEDQLSLLSVKDTVPEGEGDATTSSGNLDYLGLRRAVAAHLRAHPDRYTHFMDLQVGGEVCPRDCLHHSCKWVEGRGSHGYMWRASPQEYIQSYAVVSMFGKID
jgi:hypothetical protein